MRWLLLADIHGNLEALRTVLNHAADWPDARVLVAGDIVGYGPDPQACIDLLIERGAACVRGNHEGLVLGRIPLSHCNHAGIRAARWTRSVLSPEALAWLSALPATRPAGRSLLVCHGDLDDCERYVDGPEDARDTLDRAPGSRDGATRVVCGHTHRPVCFGGNHGWAVPPVDRPIGLDRGQRYLVNPGSVGQSRFEAPLARYARYDDESDALIFHALPYDHRAVCRRLRRLGLVPRVSMPAPTALGRRIERVRTRWARWRFAGRAAGEDPGSGST